MTTYPLPDKVRITYALKYPKGLNVFGKCASVLYPRVWWEARKKELNDPTGRKVVEAAFAVSVMCPYTIEQLEIDEHPVGYRFC